MVSAADREAARGLAADVGLAAAPAQALDVATTPIAVIIRNTARLGASSRYRVIRSL